MNWMPTLKEGCKDWRSDRMIGFDVHLSYFGNALLERFPN